jgi:hypothetical protein
MNSSEIKSYLGASYKITLDPVDYDKILMVDDKKRDDKILYDYIKTLSNKPKAYRGILNFLKINNYDISQDTNLTFAQWWDYQINKFKEQRSQFDKTPNKIIQYEIDYHQEIVDFFTINNKYKEYSSFISSIPKNSKIILPLNRLLKTLKNIIISSFDNIDKELGGEKIYLDKEIQQEWKSDMIKYIHYFSSDIKDLNSNIYKNNILKPNTFLHTLFNMEEKGVGKGEILLSYLFKNSKISGGSKAYDISLEYYNDNIIIDNKKYEVKDYSRHLCDAIRLGEGGKLTQFPFWNVIQETIYKIKTFLDDYNDDNDFDNELKNILGDLLYNLWQDLINEKENKEDTNRAVALGVRKGEINTTQLNIIRMFYFLMHELIVNIKPENKYSIELDIKDYFSNLKYVKNPEKFQEDLDESVKIYFERHKGLDAFIVFRPDKINIVEEKDLVFKVITQASVKFIEKELFDEENDIGKKMQDAFNNWKNQRDKYKKSYYDFYIEELERPHIDFIKMELEKKKEKDKEKLEKSRLAMERKVKKLKTKEAQDRLRNKWLKKNNLNNN